MSSKVLLLTSEFPPQPGGIGNHAFNLAKRLQASGYNVTVLCDTRSRNGKSERNFDQKLPFSKIRITRKRIIFASYLDRIATAFTLSQTTELIICSGKFPLWLGAFLSFFRKGKFVAILHGSEVRLPNWLLGKLTNFSLKRFDSVIAVSNYTKSLVSHLSLKNIVVIPNGFQIDQPAVLEIKQDPMPALITVGNVTRRKGQHNVIKALPVLLRKYPDLQYHIVGVASEKEQLEKLAVDLKVQDSIVFYGRVSEAEKIKLLHQADVFVMLSETTQTGDVEGFGIAILEANALGIPAIGAIGCGIEDAINDGISGKLITSNDPKQLEMALEELLDNYDTYSQNAKSWSQNFTWDKVINSYLKIFNASHTNT